MIGFKTIDASALADVTGGAARLPQPQQPNPHDPNGDRGTFERIGQWGGRKIGDLIGAGDAGERVGGRVGRRIDGKPERPE